MPRLHIAEAFPHQMLGHRGLAVAQVVQDSHRHGAVFPRDHQGGEVVGNELVDLGRLCSQYLCTVGVISELRYRLCHNICVQSVLIMD